MEEAVRRARRWPATQDIPTSIYQLEGSDSATLVRGEDRYRHFELEPRPERDMQDDMLALHQRLTKGPAQILYRGIGVDNFNGPRAIRG